MNIRHKLKELTMKTLNHLLMAAAAIVTLNLASSAQAAEPVLSPRAAQLRHEFRKVPSEASEVDLAQDRPLGNAKAWALARSFRKVPSTGPSIDLAHAPRPTLSPKDSRFETVFRENALQQVQVAPLK